MRDADKLKDAFPEAVRKALTQNNSRMYNILIILILISLTAISGYLVYDILSNRAVGAFDSYSAGLLGSGSAAVIDSWQEKGIKLFEKGKYNESIECFDKAVSENSTNSIAWKYKGNALYALRSYESAIKCYDKALLLSPSDGEALYNKGRSLFAMKRYDDARVVFAKAEKMGKWPNPMLSMNSTNTTSAKSASKATTSPQRIVVDWAHANSGGGGSVAESPHYSTPAPSASTTISAVPTIDTSKAHENVISNASMNATAIPMNASENITISNATEIKDNLIDNSSAVPSNETIVVSTAISSKLQANKDRIEERKAQMQERRVQVLAAKKSKKAPAAPEASEAQGQGANIDTSASSKTKVAKASAVKAESQSSKPQVSAAKKTAKAPKKPPTPKAPAAKSKRAPAKK
ncbi:MAG: tetratricopeptide repeat protein [Methanotrichaceae archaeon]